MKPICVEFQDRLAAEGAAALRGDLEAQRHLEECADCFRVLEQLARLDAALAAMPAHDATDRVVDGLLARVADEGAASRPPGVLSLSRPVGAVRPLFWGLAAAASVVLAIGYATPSLLRARMSVPPPSPAPRSGGDRGAVATPPPTTMAPELSKDLQLSRQRYGSDSKTRLRENEQLSRSEIDRPRAAADSSDAMTAPAPQPPQEAEAKPADEPGMDLGIEGVPGGVAGGVTGGIVGGLPGAPPPPLQGVRIGGQIKAPRRLRGNEHLPAPLVEGARVAGSVILEVQLDANGRVRNAAVLRGVVPSLDAAAVEAVKRWVYTPTLVNGVPVPVIMTVTVRFDSREPSRDDESEPREERATTEVSAPSRDDSSAPLDERATTDVPFQPATGYWANTYLPGDPVLRLLSARLRGSPLRLHEAAVQPLPPFDPPSRAGLALYLNADRRALDTPSRMLLQVGLKGSPRSGGHRPPMSLGLVLDLRGEPQAEAAGDMRALALAFAEARQPGDRFSLIVAGRPGGVAVGDDKFRHGPVSVAFDRLLAAGAAPAGPPLDLTEAVALALREAARCEDPDAALGGSAVVLVTGQRVGALVGALEDLAHQGAVAGIPLSAVGIGSGAATEELDRIALAGQGSRRRLEGRADAARLVEAELAAASGVVARAVRLRIRLGPGVRLVEVVGSRRLDEAQAERVREAERSVDLRLSRLLGLEEDRGKDEDGIQVVIPSFHAGDAHVILLDVVAERAGALAEVSVRYKDVAFLRNGVAQASLVLPAGEPSAGPLERNVLANALALRLAQDLAAAADALDAGDAARSAALVERARLLCAGLMLRQPSLAGDPLARDVEMLREYVRLLSGGARSGLQNASIADSLRYASRLKLHFGPVLRATGLL